MSQFKTIDDLDVAGKRVLVRADLNVPMKDGKVTDSTRIDRTVPTLTELTGKGARVVVMTHFGRPKGQVVAEMSLAPVAEALSKACGKPVGFATDTVGDSARQLISEMNDGDIVMLENLRFNPGEEANDKDFTAELATLGDAYVSDAFSCSHRAHASTEGLAHLMPAAAGRLMQVEVESLAAALEIPTPPVAAVVGGAKVSTKMEVLGNLASKVDVLIIGGGMANTFLFAQGIDVGNSLCEQDMADQARGILETAEKAGCDVVLPVDGVVAREFKEGAECETVALDAIPSDAMMLDIGPKSIDEVTAKLETCKTVVWNGPFGAFEIPPFDKGTNAAAQAAAKLTKEGKMTSVAGGGDTVAALAHAGVSDDFSYISTAGGAFLEWMEGKQLPGVEVLRK
ncbi:MAG: phosphoglycerate kinase [Rhodospirillaceae bacterium]|jgi:phosphoglycerate kinase|nr:phosphoglycerate kinase [Rhodospirillaceae bacterium]MBT4218378.1 phosphoglycerate kinase [Rhodospirillaceae bacterium]MBT4464280.1 phosphoglycerate kinase [Rhodospirillaceae bacterium]MBT5013302.1 phosphoglycerate kinase [Rhodospirillaceae bacterium]MBT5308300.1 phosphoglycerate kinase [Rhodospirillaceae bacterium]